MLIARGTMVTPNVRLKKPLGAGGMGTVWVAHHLALDAKVAVKVITTGWDTPALVTRFMREARTAAKLTSPHVVRVFDFGVLDGEAPFIVMELLQGESLAQRLERERTLAAPDTAALVTQTAQVLAQAHGLGVLHRDVKPANLFLVELGEPGLFVKVLDFGLAKDLGAGGGASLTGTAAAVGTPGYMSPEQLRAARKLDGRTDVWALAVVAFQCLTGRVPFGNSNVLALLERGDEVLAGLPAPLRAVFGKAFARAIDERFGEARELAAALSTALAATSVDELGRLGAGGGEAAPRPTHAVSEAPPARSGSRAVPAHRKVADEGTLRLGAALTIDPHETRPLFDALCTAIGRATGRPVHGEVYEHYDDLLKIVALGRFDLVWLPPLIALRAARGGAADPLVLPVRNGASTYSTALFVRADSPIRRLDDLRAARAAWVDRSSVGGYLLARALLRARGIDLEVAISEEIFVEAHDAVARAVLDRRADVGATYAYFEGTGPGERRVRAAGWGDAPVRVLAAQDGIPMDLIAVRPSLPVELRRALSDSLADAPEAELTRAARALLTAESFERAEPRHFEALRELLTHVDFDPG